MRIHSLVRVLPHCEEGCDFSSFCTGMRMHLKAPLIYWWCHIMYTLGTMRQSPGRIYSKMCTLKPSLQSLPLRNTRFCGLPCTAPTVHSVINKLCVVGDGAYKASRSAEWGHVDKIRNAPCRLLAAAVVSFTYNTGGVDVCWTNYSLFCGQRWCRYCLPMERLH
jgi:hypothetical protein